MKGIISLDDNVHDFRKVNAVTLKGGGDNYKCTRCGIEGYRPPLANYIKVKRCKKVLFYNCTTEESTLATVEFESRPFIIMKSLAVDGIGDKVAGDVLFSCPCPDEYKDRFSKSLWLMGEKPFRVLAGEAQEAEEQPNGEYYFK